MITNEKLERVVSLDDYDAIENALLELMPEILETQDLDVLDRYACCCHDCGVFQGEKTALYHYLSIRGISSNSIEYISRLVAALVRGEESVEMREEVVRLSSQVIALSNDHDYCWAIHLSYRYESILSMLRMGYGNDLVSQAVDDIAKYIQWVDSEMVPSHWDSDFIKYGVKVDLAEVYLLARTARTDQIKDLLYDAINYLEREGKGVFVAKRAYRLLAACRDLDADS